MKRASNYLAIVGVVLTVGLGMCLFLQILDVATAHNFTCDVPTGMHPTIQSAVVDDSCDLINLTAPVYLENITITRSVTIQGQGYMTTTVDGGGNGRVFTIHPGSVVTLTNLTITNGVPLPPEMYGGGIHNNGSHLIILNSQVSGNSALGGAGVNNEGTLTVLSTIVSHNSATFYQVGGIRNAGGEVTLVDSQIVNNSANNSGAGGIGNSGIMLITNTIVAHNITMAGSGAGIVNSIAGILTITNSLIDSNITWLGSGGGVLNNGGLRLTNSIFNNNRANVGAGGGIYNIGELTVADSTFEENYSGFRGDGIANVGQLTVSNSTFDNNSGASSAVANISSLPSSIISTTFSNNVGRAIANEGNLMLTNVILGNNNGGAVINSGALTITKSLLTGNTSSSGGGIYNTGSLAVSESRLEYNSATAMGGAVYNHRGIATLTGSTLYHNSASQGGGIANGEATAHIVDSLLHENSASVEGGGIFSSREFWSGIVVMTNTTIYSNSAPLGGGVSNWGGHFYSLNNTVNGNSASAGGGINNTNSGLVQLTNTIVAHSLNGGDCGGNVAVTSGGYNIASDDSCNLIGPGDMPDTDPLLGPLQGNGGDTWTQALLTGSPAIDTGDNAVCPATDQRGGMRPIDGNGDNDPVCDIGAYEWGALQLTAVPDLITTTQNTPVLIDVLANDFPGDNGVPVLAGVSEPGSGTAVITDTLILYTPDLDFIGTDTFTYTITDGVVTDTAVVTVTVLPLIAPTAIDDIAETNQNEPILINVLANDLPGSSGDLVLDSVGAPMSGTAVITGSLILYTPTPDFVGTDTFTYTITDGVLTDTAVVTVTVLPVDTQTFIYLPVVLKP